MDRVLQHGVVPARWPRSGVRWFFWFGGDGAAAAVPGGPTWVHVLDAPDLRVFTPRVRGDDVWVEIGSRESTDPYADTHRRTR